MNISIPYNWRPRDYQMPAWQHFQGPEEGKRGVAVWHRRAGKDLFGINMCAVKAFERVGTYWHLLPTYKQGRNIVWNGMTREGRKFIDHFPEEVVEDVNNTEMRITLINGSIYQVVGTDNVDTLVGTNPIGCIFSEYSLHDPGAWDYIRPILRENGGWALFIYTPRGHNHGYHLRNIAERRSKEKDKWFFSELAVYDDGTGKQFTNVLTPEDIEDERLAGMPEEMIQQEFFVSFEAAMVGSYYGKQMKWLRDNKRITQVPWEPRLEVHTAWDLGMDDSTTIWFYQEHAGEYRFIDYYEMNGEGLGHYVNELRKKPYVYGQHWAPWDIVIRELGTGEARIETARKMGLNFRTVSKHELLDGIEQVRNILYKCYFDAEKCERGINALNSYRKEYDEKLKMFMSRPLHDWSSHGADGFRTFAMSSRVRSLTRKNKQNFKTVDNYRYI